FRRMHIMEESGSIPAEMMAGWHSVASAAASCAGSSNWRRMMRMLSWTGLCALGGLLLAPTAGAQQPGPPGQPAGQPGGQPAAGTGEGAEKKVNINVRDMRLRAAVDFLFQGTGFNVAVEPSVPDVPITINIKDQPFKTALRMLIRIAAAQVPGLTFTDDIGLYLV